MNIVAIVSARGGSKGIPRKNLRLLAGLPLVLHSIKNLSAVELIDKIVLSTEDDEISNVVKESNFSVDVMHRPKNLADDKTPLIKVTQHVAVELEKTGYRPDIVLQMAATCPFVKPETIKKCIIPLLENKTNCTTTLKRIEHEHPYRAKKLNPDGS